VADTEIDRELLKHWLSKINEASNRTGDIIRRLRSFVNKSDAEKTPCDVHQIIDESLKLMASELRRCGVKLNFAKNDVDTRVLCDDIQIQQVLVNLLKNACDALTDSEFELRNVQIDTWDRDDQVEIVVADSGPGFADADTEQLFRRFFTSKKDGMGIGLAISRSIVEAHHGRLWADTSDLGGAAFHFTLPKEKASEAPKTVCVIDDDPSALSSMCALIQANGWKAIGFSTASEFFGNAPEQFECMVIDVDLPDTNGLAVQQTMRQQQPEIPIIVVSGHADERMASAAIREGAVTFLSKPFRPNAFSDAVSDAIARSTLATDRVRDARCME
jgi:CheY-like chemotaxis protein